MIYIYLNPDGSVEATREPSPVGSRGSSEKVNKADIVLAVDDYSLDCKVIKSRYYPVGHELIKPEDQKFVEKVMAITEERKNVDQKFVEKVLRNKAITEDIKKSGHRQAMRTIHEEPPED